MKKTTHDYNLAVINPTLNKEWHPTKNGTLKPTDISPKSGKRVWWKCNKKHEWEAVVCDRSNGNGCPYCAGQRSTEENCLLRLNPELANEWHFTRNGKLTSRDVRPSSGKTVWWQCKSGHEWQARIYSRNYGRGCPYCYGRLPTKENCLLNLNPALAKEWHPTKNRGLTPSDINVSSGKKVWWFCNSNHEWSDSVSHRSSSGRGCPYCTGRRLSDETCLLNVNPDIAKEWHPSKNGSLNPINCHAGSNKRVWWKCPKAHEWQAQVNHRLRGDKCPYCSGRLLTEENSLFKQNPTLASEWHPVLNGSLTPRDIMPWSRKKVWWQCKKGHEWESTPSNRSNGSRCLYCFSNSSMLELQIFSEIKYIFDDAKLRKKIKGKEIDIYIPSLQVGIEVDGIYWHKNKYLKDKSKTQFFKENDILLIRLRERGLEPVSENDIVHSRKTSLFSLVEKIFLILLKQDNLDKTKQEVINKYLIQGKIANESEFVKLWDMLPGPVLEDSLYAKNPGLVKDWHSEKNGRLTPKDVWAYSNKKAWWKCDKGHEWKAVVGSRNSGIGCPYCAGKIASKENCILYAYPEIAKEWHFKKNGDLEPINTTPGSHKRVWWLCLKGHEWQTTVKHRSNGTGCPFCSGRKVTEETCLLNVNPALAQECHPEKNGKLTPRDVTVGAGNIVWWKCKKGHEWQTSIDTRKRGRGCPYCSGRRKI